jgi:NitT/TauT family transport system permease protein
VIIVFGTGIKGSVAISVMVVFFVGLFNAYEGGRTVTPDLIDNVVLLGASKWAVMWHVRFPYALAWTLASLPVAISFSILTVVTGEILDGAHGMGQLIDTATSTAQASLTFAVVIILSIIAIIVVGLSEILKRRALHWWNAGR